MVVGLNLLLLWHSPPLLSLDWEKKRGAARGVGRKTLPDLRHLQKSPPFPDRKCIRHLRALLCMAPITLGRRFAVCHYCVCRQILPLGSAVDRWRRQKSERHPARIGNLRTRDLNCVIAGHHALDMCARKAVTYKVDHHLDREPVRHHHRFGAAVGGCGEQLQRAALARTWAALSLCRANFHFADSRVKSGRRQPITFALVDPDLGKVWRGRDSLLEFNPDQLEALRRCKGL